MDRMMDERNAEQTQSDGVEGYFPWDEDPQVVADEMERKRQSEPQNS
jgi:hypothetical protein